MSPSLRESEIDPVSDGAWRRPLLRAVIRLSAVVCTVWVGAIFVRAPALFPTYFGIVDSALLAAVWVAAIRPFPDGVRFAVMEAAFFGSSVVGILSYGSPPGVPVLLTLFVLMAAVYFGWKGGVAAGISSFLLLAFGAWGWTAGFLPLGAPLSGLDPTHSELWMRTIFAHVLAVCGTVGIITYFHREMGVILGRMRLAEEKFSKAFLISPDTIVITELETGRFIEVNDCFERLTGYSRREAIGSTFHELGCFPDGAYREKFASAIREKGSIHQGECRLTHRSGRPIVLMYSAERFDIGGERCILSTLQDVTDRRRAEESLKANEERFRSFIENAGVGIYRSTPDGRIVMANPALLRITGYASFEDMTSRNLESGGYEPSYRRQVFRERIERDGVLSGWEVAWTRRDGSTIFVRESATVIRGADGRPLYYDGIIEDISERERAEQALRESEERFRILTEAAFEGVVITEEGRIVDINDQALRLFGYGRHEMVGRAADDFVSREALPALTAHFSGGSEAAHEHEMVRKDGTRFSVEAQSRVTRTGGRTLRMVAIRDITERRQAENRQRFLEEQLRQMQKMEALGTLAGGIAHDFNNILTGILGNLQIAAMDLPATHPAYIALESADQASRRARDLVARILSFSRPEKENRAPASLGPIVAEAAQLLGVGLPGTVEIRTEIDPRCPPVVFDPGQIHQVIMNLGTNGLHAMRGRRGVLRVELCACAPGPALRERHPQVNAGHTVRARLQDTGCGMDAEVMKRIFEPFYTTKTFGQGTGLGLAMVHAIMRSHKGAIVVESEPGAGTTFDLYFPAEIEPGLKPGAGTRAAGRPTIAPFGRGRKVLLVDDDAAILGIGANLLTRLGFLPIIFSRATEALEAYREAPAGFVLVISDLTMPEMTGLELSAHVLSVRHDIPVILTSGYLNAETQQRARESGVRCLINKPFDLRELVAQVRWLLDEPAEAEAPVEGRRG